VPRDWENPNGWPEVCLADIASRDWSLVVLHDLPTGAMERLPDFLHLLEARGIELSHELPEACVPLRRGQPTASYPVITR
jgi:hypothetical protein